MIGNKIDISNEEREVSFEEGSEFAKENNIIFYESSCKLSNDEENSIQSIINNLFKLIHFDKRRISYQKRSNSNFINNENNKKASCC